MAGRQSAAVDRALARIKQGSCTAYRAAKLEGIALTTIYRALKRQRAASRTKKRKK